MSDFDLEDDGDDMPTAPFWMATFSDMATLLLTFFVLIVSMSEVQVKKFKEALSSFNGRTSVLEYESMVSPVNPQFPDEAKDRSIEDAENYENLLAYLREEGLEDKVRANLTDQGLHVSINDSLVFASGQAVLKRSSLSILATLSGALGGAVQSVVVEGHTDDRPIRTAQYPSNWELSGARAAAVVRYFSTLDSGLPPERYTVIGHGEHRPMASNDTPEGRARNRRVEILFSTAPWQKTSTPIPTP